MKKKLLCMLLALVMCAAWAVPALAAEGGPFDIYQIAVLEDGKYTVNTAWEGFVKIDGDTAYYRSGEEWTPFTETLSAETIQSFLKYAQEKKMKTDGTVQEQNGSISFTDIEKKGYYLIDYKNGTCGLYNWHGQNEMPHKKNDGGPGVEKKIKLANGDLVDWTTVKLGDDVQFEVKVTLPSKEDIDNLYNYALSIVDEVSGGLKLNKDVEVILGGKTVVKAGNDQLVKLSEIKGDAITVQYQDDGKQFSVKFGEGGQATGGTVTFLQEHSGAELILRYSAKVIQNSEENPREYNKVTYTYGTKTEHDVVHVYDFTVIVNKTDKDDGSPLSGAEFILAKVDENGDESFYCSDQKADQSNHSGNSVEWRADVKWDNEKAELIIPEDIKERLRVVRVTEKENAEGKTHFEGIPTGEYHLYEIKAPDGYARKKEPIKIKIKEIEASIPDTFEASHPHDEPASENKFMVQFQYQIDDGEWVRINSGAGIWGHGWNQLNLSTTVENVKDNVLLPSTGGIGTTIFYFAGGALVLGAAIVLIVKRRGSAG